MDTRRGVLKKLVGGAAATAVAGGTAAATKSSLDTLVSGAVSLPTGPAPWWLFAPIGMGTPLKFGWYVAGLSSVERGASVLTLAHASGRKARVHLCTHGGSPRGVAHSRLVDFVLMDGGSGSFRTDEKLGRVILGLAERVRRNESDPSGDLTPIARMMAHDERVEAFGGESLG